MNKTKKGLLGLMVMALIIGCTNPTGSDKDIDPQIVERIEIPVLYKVSDSYKQTDCFIYENNILNHVIINYKNSDVRDTIFVLEGAQLHAEYYRSDASGLCKSDATASKDLLWEIKI